MTDNAQHSFDASANERKKITKLPLNWPTDKRTKRTDYAGLILIVHPDRAPHTSEDGRTWVEVVPLVSEVNTVASIEDVSVVDGEVVAEIRIKNTSTFP